MLDKFNEGKIEKKVIGIEFSSDGGLVTAREVYEDGSVGGNLEEVGTLETNDLPGIRKLRGELKEKYGEDVKI
ncbi:MAG: hypothetical protein WC229_01185 [Candidatus Paceibacterota bacterium]|jgi:hypothetical protein